VQDVEAKYYADGEDAYEMRNYFNPNSAAAKASGKRFAKGGPLAAAAEKQRQAAAAQHKADKQQQEKQQQQGQQQQQQHGEQ
jgi:hypothetical protein